MVTEAPATTTNFSLDLNEEQLQLQRRVHEFAEKVVRPAAHAWDEREETPWPIIQEAAQVGLYGTQFMVRLQSDGAGLMIPIAIEELFWGDAGIGMAIVGTSLAVASIVGSGTPQQIGEWMPQCYGTPDDVKLGAFCVSEPDAGSDVAAMKTRAVYNAAKDEWTLNGQKTWISNGGIAAVHVVVASVDPALGTRGQASFIVGPNTPGLRQGVKFKKMGIRASHTAEVYLDDVHVPGSCLLGGKEELDARLARAREGLKSGVQAALSTFESTRPAVGAMALGTARAAYEWVLDYAKERQQFGKPIIENEAISFTLANMKTEIDAARLLVWRAAWMAHNRKPLLNGEGSMAKLKAGEVCVWATERAIQIAGGVGYVREAPLERWHRDSKIFTIFEGTSEIQQLVIARAISGMRLA
jgi:alkylation response protein AidB-like acyl-CoA dehydrogenase